MECLPTSPAILCAIGAPFHGPGCNCANDRAQIVYGPGSEPRVAPAPIKANSVVGYMRTETDGVSIKLSCGCLVEQEEGTEVDVLAAALANHHCQKRERARRLRSVN
jgi:hypothetical protein